jgi:hypothetical protein
MKVDFIKFVRGRQARHPSQGRFELSGNRSSRTCEYKMTLRHRDVKLVTWLEKASFRELFGEQSRKRRSVRTGSHVGRDCSMRLVDEMRRMLRWCGRSDVGGLFFMDRNLLLFCYHLIHYANHLWETLVQSNPFHSKLIIAYRALTNRCFQKMTWRRLIFHHPFKCYANHILTNANRYRHSHLKLVLISNALKSRHFQRVIWYLLL